MIDELRFYRMQPGAVEAYLDLSQGIAIPFRGNDYGELLGFWTVGAGTLSSVVNLWRHESLEHREVLRRRLSESPLWRDYMAKSHPLNQHQSVRILAPTMPLSMPESTGNVYELRFLQARTGQAAAVAESLRAAAPSGPGAVTIGVWTNLFGEIYEIVSLSVHADLQRSLAGQWASAWGTFLREHASRIDAVDSHVLLPIAASPMR